VGGGPSGQDPRAKYGRGRCIDGEYEYYEYPYEGFDPVKAAAQDDITALDILAQEDRLICDFQQHYGLAIDDPACPLTWRQFITRMHGLFMVDSRTARHFATTPTDEPTGEPEEVL
jgi:hypothetical protein